MNESHASYSVIVIEKFYVKIVYAIYSMAYTSRHYGIKIINELNDLNQRIRDYNLGYQNKQGNTVCIEFTGFFFSILKIKNK